MNKYINYHKHDHVSNIFTPDVNVKPIDYVNRIVELGYDTYFTTNHGSGGDIFDSRDVCDANNIHCKFGIEGYIVPNASEKDGRNYHIILIPRTNVARKKLNLASSHANTDGYYYKPRFFMSDLLNNFDNNDLYITTACVAGLLKDNDSIYQIFYPLYEKYGTNIMLEVQNHNADIQKTINKKALKYHYDLGLPLIAANDSHYIYPNQAKERLELLRGKGINYGDEDTFILDYPDYETFAKRFKEQGILSEQNIIDAIEQTLIFEECEDIDINKNIKMPTIYPELTNEEKIKLLKKEVNDNFKIIMKEEHVTKEERKKYVAECRKEMQVIEDTNEEIHTADYFLLNKRVYDLASGKYHGVLTKTGRGSCGSFILNKMLGMTQIDRLRTDLPLYSERFISTARLLENHSLPDYDFNCATQEPFIKATRELLGEYQCYPMLAYGTMQESESFRNACRSDGLEFDTFNEVGKNLDNYRSDPYWKKYIDMAQTYIGTIISCSVHPCSFLLMNEDIREELGILKIGDAYCAPITSGEADAWKYLKNDYLIVTVWDIIKQTFDMIGQPIMSIKELEANLDDKVWELFDKGYTATINQIDGDWATSLIKKYKPRSVSEMAKFVACIRPSFETMRDDFLAHKPYTTGFENIDKLFASTDNRVLFQENIMQYFEWLGVTPSESIGIIKKISKKKIKPKDFAVLEDRLRENWKKNNGTEEGFDESWADMQSQMAYSFNSPHGLAYAYDGLYCAYLKSHYPLEYYTVTLNIYKDDVEKSNRLCNEMANFGIKLSNVKFRYSNDTYTMDKKHNTIYKSVSSIKNIGKDTGDKLYALRDIHFNNFIDVLSTIDINKCCNSRELEILISIGFFDEFGNPNQLLKIVGLYNRFATAKVLSKDKLTQEEKQIIHNYAQKETPKQFRDIDNIGLLWELCNKLNITTSDIDRVSYELKYLGYSNIIADTPYFGVESIETNQYGTTYIKLYRISVGDSLTFKVDRKWMNQFTQEYNGTLEQGDILDVTIEEKPKRRKVDDAWVEVGTELVLTAFCRK
jgi:DNA polymerase III alpha subunit